MHKLRSRIRSILVLMTVPVIATCGSDPTAVSDIIASIVVTPGNPILAALGLTQQFVATARDAAGNSLTGKTFEWSSSSAGVATVDASTGLATAVGNGTATITAQSEGISGSATLGITQAVTAVTVTASTTTLTSFGETIQLTSAAADANGNAVANASPTWTSSDPAIATVSSSGVVTSVSNGVATITATSGGTDGTVDITVAQQASQLSVSQQPSPAAASGAILATQPAVQLLDANGNAVAQAGVAISATIGSGGGTLSGTTTAMTAATGIATFTDLAITGTSGSRTLAFASGALTGAVSSGIAVGAGSVDPGQSTVTAPTSIVAGAVSNVVIQTNDAAGTAVSVGGATVVVTVTGANPATPTVTDNADGTYTATYTPTAVGTDNIAVTINGGTAANSPLATVVTVGAADAASSTANVVGGPVGTPTTITVQANDAFGNALATSGGTVVMSVSGANTATPTVTDNNDGTYSGTYTPTVAGTDMISVSLGGTAISGSPFTNTVGMGSADAGQTTATVPAGTSGSLTSITIQTRDTGGNNLTTGGESVTANVTGANSIAAAVTDNADGTYTATYTPIAAGTDNIAIALNGNAIGGGPYTSVVAAGPLSPTQSTAVVPATGTSGIATTIVTTARDANSNILTVGGATVVISVTGANTVSPTVTDNADGTYSTSYTPTAVGVDNITVTMNGSSVSGSPFLSTVAVGAVDPASSTTTVPTTTAAGAAAAIVVTARDVNGNLIGTGGHTVAVTVAGANPATLTVTDNSDGTYSTSYTPTATGTDNITITLNGVAVTGSPFANVITVGAVDPAQSTAVIPSGAAGTASAITVTARDANGNALTTGGATVVVNVTGANTAAPPVTDNADGTYSAMYTPTTPGTDNIAITLDGTAINGSPFASVVGVGAADPVQTTATVPAGTAGVVTTITVQARDGAGNNLAAGGEAVAVAVTGANTATPTVTDNADGTYTATYTPTISGTDNLAITLNATAIGGGPYTSVVATAAVDPLQSTAVVPATAIAGAATNITVTARDAFGNQQTFGGATVVVAITGANTATPVITDNADGTYTTSYTPTASGSDAAAITINGTAINGSPFASVVSPGTADPAQTLATVPANGTAGTASAITVTTQDANGNPLTTGGATVVVNVTGANTATPVVTDNADGTYSASYTPTLVGTDNVAITLNGAAVASSPFTSTIAAGAADPAASTAVVPAAGTAGAASAITVTARDANGNQQPAGGATVVVTVSGANTATPVVTDNADGTYAASYTPTVSGTDNIAITLNGTAIGASPFVSTIATGVLDPAQSTAVVPAGTAGAASAITITARDANGNALTVGGATAVVTITGANAATPPVTDNADGTYSTTYTPTVSGTDNIAITLNGAAINSSPFTSTVAAGALDPAQSTATVPGIGTQAVPTNIVVTGKDANGNQVAVGGATVVINVTGANTASPTPVDNADGTYSASYTPANNGSDNIVVTMNGTAVIGSPFTSVIGGTVNPAQSTATIPAGTAGAPVAITVTARDGTGTPVGVGGNTVVITITGPNANVPVVTDVGDGTYTASYTPTVAGTNVDTLAITIEATPIGGSPFTNTVAHSTLDIAASTITKPDTVPAGRDTTVAVVTRDTFGNQLTAGGATVVVFISGDNPVNLPATDVGDGTYTVTYSPVVVGSDDHSATINGTTIGGGPYTSIVIPGTSSAPQSTAVVPASGAVGVATNITVQAKDSSGNNRTIGGDTVVVTITGANTINPVVTDVGDGTYTASYTPTAAGADNIAITLNSGGAINGSPFTSTVGAGAANPAMSTATVPATGTVGVATAITVQAKDGAGTNPTTGGEIVVVDVTGANTATPVVTDVGDGTYTATYTPTLAGSDNIAITMNSSPIGGSPYASVVAAAGPSAPNSIAIVPNGTSGTATDIFIQARDIGDNDITVGGATVVVTVTGTNSATPVVTDNADGTYTASYTPGANGTDNVAITIGGAAIDNSPYTSEVTAVTAMSGQIVFESDRDTGTGDTDVFAMDTDGSNVINITNNPYFSDERPSVSPDGTKIVFNSDRDGDHDIYVMNSNGSGITQLTNSGGRDRIPEWSPDGSQIVFLSERDGDSEIFIMNADGSSQTNITDNGFDDFQATWSPDGSQISFYRNGDIFIINANGSGETNLTNSPLENDYESSWGAGGIVFVSDRDGVGLNTTEVYKIQSDGTGLTRLTNDATFDYIPEWSNDGSQIIWINAGDIFRMNADGTSIVELLSDSGLKWAPKYTP